MIKVDTTQGTEAWKQIRRGIPTASNFDKIITTKGEPSKQREKYLYQLAGERVSNSSEETYQSKAMERGVLMEQEARELYEIVKDCTVEQVGFVYYDDKQTFGCSPDGLVGEDGVIEIKCPTMAVHVQYVLDNKLPMDYFQQVQGELYVTGRKWADFVSYYPGIKPLILRVNREQEFINKLHVELEKFNKELDQIVERLRA